MHRIRLEPNIPLTLSLIDPQADSAERFDFDLGIGQYRTTDGRILALPRQACVDLNALNPKPGEEIGVCRYTGKDSRIAVWLTASAEKQRRDEEQAEVPSDELILLEASVKREDARKRRNGKPTPIRKEPAPATESAQPRLFDQRGTGTDGPLPAVAPRVAVRPAAATKTPYGTMLRHIIRTVETALKDCGVQLGDAPKQDLITTVYIDAARRSGVEYDFTTEGH